MTFANSMIGPEAGKSSLVCGPSKESAVQTKLNSSTRKGSQPLHQEVVNQLYEEACGISLSKIREFYRSLKSRPALPDIWQEILTHRTSNSMWTLGAKDNPPYPRGLLRPTSRLNGTPKPFAQVREAVDDTLRRNAKIDLSRIKILCTKTEPKKTEVIVID
jgi:hypothetical protein